MLLSCLPRILIIINPVKKAQISFNQEFIKTLTIMRVKKNFCGKLCTSVLFNGVTFIAAIFLIVRQLGFQNEKYM